MSTSPTRKVSPNSLTNQIERPLKNGVNGNDSMCMESSEDDSLQYHHHNVPSVLAYNKQCPMSLGNDTLQSPSSSVFTASNNNELMYISQPNLSLSNKNSDLIDGLSLYSSSPPSLYSPPLPASPVTHSEPESLTNEENLTDYHATTDDEENHFEEHERVSDLLSYKLCGANPNRISI